MLSPVNTFEDTVKILKNRSILSEGIGGVATKGTTPDWHKIFKEKINEYGSSDYIEDFKDAKKYAQAISAKHGVVQHVNEVPSGGYKVSDWYDDDTTLISYENGLQLNEESLEENKDISIKGKKVKNAKQNGDKSYTVEYSDGTTKKIAVSNDAWDEINDKYGKSANLKEAKEAKAEEKESTKEVTDMETKGYDYKDKKNYDNVFGEEFLKGFYTEMGDPNNEGKDVNKLKQIVAKNLAKDCNYYVKDGQFGVKGVGYQTEVPGLGTPKEAKGKFKSSGYGDLKESVLRAFISETIKEVLMENMDSEDELYRIVSKYVKDADEVNAELYNYYESGYKGFSDSVQANLSRDPEFQSWVQKGHDEETFKREIGEVLTPEDEEEFTRAVEDAEQLYEKTGSIKGAMKYLPKEYNRFRAEIEQHLIQKYEGNG
jgi:hypothetical protein